MSVPITREYLKQHYSQYPIDPIGDNVKELEENLKTLCGQLDNLLKDKHTGSDYTDYEAEFKTEWCKRIDENNFRNREQCDHIIHTFREEIIASLENVMKGAGVPAQGVSGASGVMKGVVEMAKDARDAVKNWQESNSLRVQEQVSKFLPQDFRATMLRKSKERGEKKAKAEVDKLIADGGTIKEQYDLLWKQQMARRQTLVDLGNATGVYKIALKWLGGVPQVLLDFVKTINHEEGPMEELRIRYGPNLYYLLQYINRIHIACTMTAAAIPYMEYNNADTSKPSTNASLNIIEQAMKVYIAEVKKYLDFMHNLLEDSPFFVTAQQMAGATGDADAELTVSRGTKEEVEINISEVGTVISWAFTTQSRDIGFGVTYTPEGENQETLEVVPIEKKQSHKETISGNLTVDKPGIYALVFDNSFSRFYSKAVKYRVSVVRPGEDIDEDNDKDVATA